MRCSSLMDVHRSPIAASTRKHIARRCSCSTSLTRWYRSREFLSSSTTSLRETMRSGREYCVVGIIRKNPNRTTGLRLIFGGEAAAQTLPPPPFRDDFQSFFCGKFTTTYQSFQSFISNSSFGCVFQTEDKKER